MKKKCSNFQNFFSNDDGTVAILFSLCLIVLMCSAGLAVDTIRGYQAENELTQALDATSLAVARALRLEDLDDGKLNDKAKLFFNENFSSRAAATTRLQDFDVVLDHKLNRATVSATVELPTFIAPLMHTNALLISRTSSAQYDMKNLELSLTLDTSGSMQGQKIEDLHNAAKRLVDIVINKNQSGAKNRVGIAPYSTSVNAGIYAEEAAGKSAGNTCVSERPGKPTDAEPRGNHLGRKASSCPSGEITPLSDDKDMLAQRIDSMSANGATAGHLGIAWSWYILSPEWRSFWPSASAPQPYDDPETVKAAVILTDGIFNITYERGNGDSVSQAKETCDSMKAKGITIFTIGFQAPPESLETLKYCATSEQNFFDAQEGAALRAAFETIGDNLTTLRLIN